MSLEQALRAHSQQRREALAHAVRQASTAPATAARLAGAGLTADGDPDELLARLPVLHKDELIAAQQADPPFGGGLPAGVRPLRLFQSPGPIYEAQVDAEDPWGWAEALRDLGVGEGDIAINCFGYHLSPAGAMFDLGLQAVGAGVIPAGIGNQELQLAAIADARASTYIGLPSYLKALIDRWDGRELPLRRALLTAEPLPPSLRAELEASIAVVRMSYGTAEAGCIAYEDGTGPGMRLSSDILVQICDPLTGEPLDDETEGEVVITSLRGRAPLLRFGTGDLSAWTLGEDGSLRLAGVLGRTGEAVKVRGMFLHPRQATAALAGIEGVEAFRFVIDRADHRDAVTCHVLGSSGDATLAERVSVAVRERLRFKAEVLLVDQLDEGPVLLDQRVWE